MAGKKYYAVKVGRETGIFTTWDACKAQVQGYSGA
ncbi:MAG: RNase H1/viroplasmin domain-containing protein, partial [Peptococcaceae bacterium]|nr:RNase H1/viroplasmin domain-containing protein [Peptococcaceae bacterium]